MMIYKGYKYDKILRRLFYIILNYGELSNYFIIIFILRCDYDECIESILFPSYFYYIHKLKEFRYLN